MHHGLILTHGKKSLTDDSILQCFIYVKCPEQENSQKQKDQCCSYSLIAGTKYLTPKSYRTGLFWLTVCRGFSPQQAGSKAGWRAAEKQSTVGSRKQQPFCFPFFSIQSTSPLVLLTPKVHLLSSVDHTQNSAKPIRRLIQYHPRSSHSQKSHPCGYEAWGVHMDVSHDSAFCDGKCSWL